MTFSESVTNNLFELWTAHIDIERQIREMNTIIKNFLLANNYALGVVQFQQKINDSSLASHQAALKRIQQLEKRLELAESRIKEIQRTNLISLEKRVELAEHRIRNLQDKVN